MTDRHVEPPRYTLTDTDPTGAVTSASCSDLAGARRVVQMWGRPVRIVDHVDSIHGRIFPSGRIRWKGPAR